MSQTLTSLLNVSKKQDNIASRILLEIGVATSMMSNLSRTNSQHQNHIMNLCKLYRNSSRQLRQLLGLNVEEKLEELEDREADIVVLERHN